MLQPHNDGAERRVSARIESCFRFQRELQLADQLACPSRDPDGYGPRDSSVRIPLSVASGAVHSGRSHGRASLADDFQPSAQQHRSATDCERRCVLAGFRCPLQLKLHRLQTSSLGRITKIGAAVCKPTLLAIAVQPREHWDFASR
jgi:hypothetical protein